MTGRIFFRGDPLFVAKVEDLIRSSTIATISAAGIKVDTPPLTILRRAWRQASAEERAAFCAETGLASPPRPSRGDET